METQLEPRGGGRFGDVIDGDAELEQFLERCENWGDGMLDARSRMSGSHFCIMINRHGKFNSVSIYETKKDGRFYPKMPF